MSDSTKTMSRAQMIQVAAKQIENSLDNPTMNELYQVMCVLEVFAEAVANGETETAKPALPIQNISNRLYDIEFGQDCKAGIRVKDNELEVVGAMNRYGHTIDLERIKVSLLDDC